MRSWSSINVLCTEPGVATRTDPTTPPHILSLSLSLSLNRALQSYISNLNPDPDVSKNGSTALLCMVTKPREWEERLLLMSILPDLWLTMTEYGYHANRAIKIECEVVASNPPYPYSYPYPYP